jgi:hypothetical protein
VFVQGGLLRFGSQIPINVLEARDLEANVLKLRKSLCSRWRVGGLGRRVSARPVLRTQVG